VSDCSDMCGKKEFGVKDDTEVMDVGAPWDSRVCNLQDYLFQMNRSARYTPF